MDTKVTLAFGVVVCFLGCAFAAPVAPQYQRNFIPNRYDVRGTLIHADGSFSRQDPPSDDGAMYDQFAGNAQQSNLAYAPQNDYPSQEQPPSLQAYNDYQQPSQQNEFEQNAHYNRAPQEPERYGDDLGTPREDENILPQQYAPANNLEPMDQPASPYQGYQGYNGEQPAQQDYYQPSPEASDDTIGVSRDTKERTTSDDIDAAKKYKIPSNLSKKNLQGILGNTKQIYLRGGH